jgi:hypothetical protein
MKSLRPIALAASCALPLTLAACGSSSSGGGTVTPEGTHYGYVIDSITVPPTTQAAMTSPSYGLDLAGSKSGTPDGLIDNQLGQAIAALIGFKFPVQETVTASIDQGSIVLLIDFQTKDFASTAAAGLNIKLGDAGAGKIMPAPCAAGSTTDCRHHLAGTGTFAVAAASPNNAALAGAIVGGKFAGGPGDVSLQLALGSTSMPITLSLLTARATATGISATGMDGILGGAVTASDLMTQVLPAVAAQIPAVIARDCTPVSATDCGCKVGSTGQTVLTTFDGDDGTAKDCKVTLAEIAANALIKGLLAPDVCSMKTCTAPDAVSIGVKFHAVKATFPM